MRVELMRGRIISVEKEGPYKGLHSIRFYTLQPGYSSVILPSILQGYCSLSGQYKMTCNLVKGVEILLRGSRHFQSSDSRLFYTDVRVEGASFLFKPCNINENIYMNMYIN